MAPAAQDAAPSEGSAALGFLGSLPRCLALAYVGKVLGNNWDSIKNYFHGADVVVAIVLAVLLALYIYHHIASDRKYVKSKKNAE